MENTFYYCVLKSYKGIFTKKHIGNTHAFFIPLQDTEEFLYLIVLGKLNSDITKLVCIQLLRNDIQLMDHYLEKEIEYFKDRFIILDELQCHTNEIDDGIYNIKFDRNRCPEKVCDPIGKYIKSDIKIELDLEKSNKQKIYIISGKIDLEASNVSKQNYLIVAKQKFSLLKRKI